jgi:hypothetical protein
MGPLDFFEMTALRNKNQKESFGGRGKKKT